ncbi:MAG: FtsX-like permease family protein [Candidatus Hodarchaeales archaeon]
MSSIQKRQENLKGTIRRNIGCYKSTTIITLRLIGRNADYSFKTVISISLIIAMVISLFSLLSGFSTEIASLTSQAGTSSYIIISENTKDYSTSRIPSQITDVLAGISNLEMIFPQVLLPITVNLAENTTFETYLWGVNLTTLLSFKPDNALRSGYLPSTSNSTANTTSCLAGMTFESVTGSQINPGANISCMLSSSERVVNLTLTGVFYERGMHHDGLVTWINDSWLVNPDMTGFYSVVEIKLRSPVLADKTLLEIQEAIKVMDWDVTIEFEKKNAEFLDSLFGEILRKLDYFVTALFIIILLKIFHSTSWLLLQHERDLKLLRILGSSRLNVSFTAYLISLFIGNLGFLAGVFFGLLAPSFLVFSLSLFVDVRSVVFFIEEADLINVFLMTNFSIVLGSIYPLVKLFNQPLIIPPSINEMGTN